MSDQYRTMKFLLQIFVSSTISLASFAQADTAFVNDVKRFQADLVTEYSDPKTTPLNTEAKKEFKGVHFYAIDKAYKVEAMFKRTAEEKIFSMKTSGSTTKDYVKYGEATFTLKGKEYKLNVYQSIDLAKQRKYRDYLFIPFRDLTSGKETYGGGRYIDLTIPSDSTLVINFNKAYHPYCAYTEGYNCPIPPRENTLSVKIEAGVKY